MAWYALEAARQVTAAKPVMVIGHAADQVRQVLGDQAEYVLQEPQLGTGHAVMQAEPLLSGKSDLVLVTYADMPLLTARHACQRWWKWPSLIPTPVSMLTVTTAETRGFGRILRDLTRAGEWHRRGSPGYSRAAGHPRAQPGRVLLPRRLAVVGIEAHHAFTQRRVLPD